MKGSAVVTSGPSQVRIDEGCVYLHKANLPYAVQVHAFFCFPGKLLEATNYSIQIQRDEGSIGLTVAMVPKRKQVV